MIADVLLNTLKEQREDYRKDNPLSSNIGRCQSLDWLHWSSKTFRHRENLSQMSAYF